MKNIWPAIMIPLAMGILGWATALMQQFVGVHW
jgi:hypothetical protein